MRNDPDARERLKDDGGGTIRRIAWLCDETLRDLALNRAGQQRKLRVIAEQVEQKRRGDLVGQIRHELARPVSPRGARPDRLRVHTMFPGQGVAANQRKARLGGETLGEDRLQPAIDFDRDHRRGAGQQQLAERAGAGPHFQNHVARCDFGGIDEFAHQIQIDQEVLAEAVPRGQAGAGQQRADFREGLTGHA